MAQKMKLVSADSTFEGLLLGLVTQLRDYQICWHLNKIFHFEMKMMDDLVLTQKKKNKTSVFSWFKFENDLDKLLIYLVSNKHSGEYLVPELKQADFILMMQGEISDEMRKEIFSTIKHIHAIQMVIEIDYSKLKSKENLLLE